MYNLFHHQAKAPATFPQEILMGTKIYVSSVQFNFRIVSDERQALHNLNLDVTGR